METYTVTYQTSDRVLHTDTIEAYNTVDVALRMLETRNDITLFTSIEEL